ncbi:CBS domain-containing protein [Streptomyces sp. NPDC058045]|uniref:CBS domain-containing protein n=1 Tax=Streptomyces sp. NPDC058045 TaxID=3346311 RepID=UPI0036ED02C3
MAGAGVGHLLVCDEDGIRTGLITLARLTAVRDGSGYTDRIRLRDISGAADHSPRRGRRPKPTARSAATRPAPCPWWVTGTAVTRPSSPSPAESAPHGRSFRPSPCEVSCAV